MNSQSSRRYSRSWLWGVALCLAAASVFPFWYATRAELPKAAASPGEKPNTPPRGVSCLGRIEPEGGVIHVAGAYVLGEPHPPVVEKLLVKEGDHVHRGDLLATFVGQAQLVAGLAQARAQTEVARRRLEQVKAGAKKPDRAAQQAEIAQLTADWQNARTELQRYEALRRTDDVTASELDARRTAVTVAEQRLDESRQRLLSLEDVPDTDLQLAEAQLNAAIANQQRAQRDAAISAIHAPMDGEVLIVYAHPGETVGADGLLDMGRTSQMEVVAEVYETDVGRVQLGQTATISGELLSSPLTGTVVRIDPTVKVASVMPGDTISYSDHRIVEARIRLDDGQAVTGLINGRVTVYIQP